MVVQGETVVMTLKELDLDREAVVLKTLEKVKANLIQSDSKGETLDIEGVMRKLKKGRSTIQAYRRRKVNPLPMKGNPPLILEKDAWDWYVNHSGDYQPQ